MNLYTRESMLNPAEQRAKAEAVADFLLNHCDDWETFNAYQTFKAEHPGWTHGGGLTVHGGRCYIVN